MMDDVERQRPLTGIVSALINQLSAHVEIEARLAGRELSEKIAAASRGVLVCVIGAALLLPGIGILGIAAVAALLRAGVTDYVAASIVGGGIVGIGGVVLWSGAERLRTLSFVPTKTFGQIRQDFAAANNR